MSPDDPRHGTTAGYIAGCRDQECLRAKVRYAKRRRLELLTTRQRRIVPTWRALRRIQALQALGWSVPAIAKEVGKNHRHLYSLSRHPTIYASTFVEIDAAYQRMLMRTPSAITPSERSSVTKAKRYAARMGYVPPLAWDDIDDPDEQPRDWHYRAPDRADAVADFAEQGLNATQAARRLHTSREALEVWCRRHGLSAEFRRMAAREALGGNQWTREESA